MRTDIQRALVETTVRRSLDRAREDPGRSVRNLVDLAVESSSGPFQRPFFERVQDILHTDNGCPYAALTRRLATEVDLDHLVSFGINLGLEGCVRGAEKIRRSEAERGFNIPWALPLDLPCGKDAVERAASVVEEARGLGVHTFLVAAKTRAAEALCLAARFEDCAFVVFARGEALTATAASEAYLVRNALVSVRATDGDASYACSLLRSMRLPYAVHISYPLDGEQGSPERVFARALALRPHVAILSPLPGCDPQAVERMYHRVCRGREQQRFSALVVELFSDLLAIDSVISHDTCLAKVDPCGRLASGGKILSPHGMSAYKDGLAALFAATFPKAA